MKMRQKFYDMLSMEIKGQQDNEMAHKQQML